jgi:hypothetical protein
VKIFFVKITTNEIATKHIFCFSSHKTNKTQQQTHTLTSLRSGMSTYRRVYKAALSPNLAEMIKPKKIEETGKWRSPFLSRRKQADIRKNAILDGTYGQFNTETGCWCLAIVALVYTLFVLFYKEVKCVL